jgi:hypothetical protein
MEHFQIKGTLICLNINISPRSVAVKKEKSCFPSSSDLSGAVRCFDLGDLQNAVMSLADSNYVPINSFPWYAFNQIRSCV